MPIENTPFESFTLLNELASVILSKVTVSPFIVYFIVPYEDKTLPSTNFI